MLSLKVLKLCHCMLRVLKFPHALQQDCVCCVKSAVYKTNYKALLHAQDYYITSILVIVASLEDLLMGPSEK